MNVPGPNHAKTRCDIAEPESALGAISSAVQVGRTALLTVVTEQSPEVVDTAMSNLGGTVLRRPVADVLGPPVAPLYAIWRVTPKELQSW